MSIELNKESVEQADASSCQGTNCGTTTGDHSSECLAEAAAGQGWELKPGDLCGRDCPIHKISVEQAGGDERAALQELIRVRDWVKNRRGQPEKLKNTGQTYIMIEKCETLDMLEWAIERARAALAHRAPEVCSECSDTGKVYDESGDGPWSCYACTGNPEVIGYANGDELDNMLDDRTAVLSPGKTSFHTVPVYRLIRAALAQPSPKCVKCGGTGEADSGGVHPWGEPVLIPCDCETEQEEAERPEVVGVRYEDGTILSAEDCGIALEVCARVQTPLMTVAQHERIVGALRAERDGAIKLLGQSVWQKIERLTQERDAALARVAELEKELAMTRDAAAKGDAARQQCGGREMEIEELRAEAQALREEVAALRARVAVVPDAANDRRKSAHYCRGWNACLDELARLNGMTVSEGLLRRLCEPLFSHADYVVALNELRALLSEQE